MRRRVKKFCILLCYAFACTAAGRRAQADDVHVAVAANFLATLQQVADGFSQSHPHHVIISSGSTGKL